MTVYGLVSSCVWAAVALVVAWRVERIILAHRVDEAPIANEPVTIPPDLVAFIANFTSDWARADAKKAVLERYEHSHDWNVVRRAVGVGVMN